MKHKLLLSIVFLIHFYSVFSQNQTQNIIVFKRGYLGGEVYDSCKIKKDTVFETIKVKKFDGKSYRNESKSNIQKTDSLIAFINANWDVIYRLVEFSKNEKTAKFIPPYPNCVDYEEFIFFKDNIKYQFKIFDHKFNETYVALKNDELKIFDSIKEIIHNL